MPLDTPRINEAWHWSIRAGSERIWEVRTQASALKRAYRALSMHWQRDTASPAYSTSTTRARPSIGRQLAAKLGRAANRSLLLPPLTPTPLCPQGRRGGIFGL